MQEQQHGPGPVDPDQPDSEALAGHMDTEPDPRADDPSIDADFDAVELPGNGPEFDPATPEDELATVPVDPDQGGDLDGDSGDAAEPDADVPDVEPYPDTDVDGADPEDAAGDDPDPDGDVDHEPAKNPDEQPDDVEPDPDAVEPDVAPGELTVNP